MNPWTAQSVAAEHNRDLHRQAATSRLARQTRQTRAVPQARPRWQFIAIGRTANPRPA